MLRRLTENVFKAMGADGKSARLAVHEENLEQDALNNDCPASGCRAAIATIEDRIDEYERAGKDKSELWTAQANRVRLSVQGVGVGSTPVPFPTRDIGCAFAKR